MTRDEVFAYVAKRYGTQPEFMWAKHPHFGVLRHSENRKWYALVMNVDASKLGIEGDEAREVLNVKCDPDDALMLRLADDIMPAYHMNKKNWISILIDGDTPNHFIEALIDASYQLTL